MITITLDYNSRNIWLKYLFLSRRAISDFKKSSFQFIAEKI